jgi:hypothetical protein
MLLVRFEKVYGKSTPRVIESSYREYFVDIPSDVDLTPCNNSSSGYEKV